eukprot:767837-Hanusia_phi.AAC.5
MLVLTPSGRGPGYAKFKSKLSPSRLGVKSVRSVPDRTVLYPICRRVIAVLGYGTVSGLGRC